MLGWPETAIVCSLDLLVYGIGSPVIGTLVDRFGPWLSGWPLCFCPVCLSEEGKVNRKKNK
jgi:hypothetical protein